MTFTTEGMRLEGLLRALQGDIMAAAGVIVLAVVGLLVARRFIAGTERGQTLDPAGARKARSTANQLFAAIVIITLAALAWRFTAVSAINRMPRADADKAGVYQQMKQNAGEAGSRSSAPQ